MFFRGNGCCVLHISKFFQCISFWLVFLYFGRFNIWCNVKKIVFYSLPVARGFYSTRGKNLYFAVCVYFACTCKFGVPHKLLLLFLIFQDLNIENPKTCETFHIGLSPYFVITHEEGNEEKPSVNSVYTFTSGLKLLLVKKPKKPKKDFFCRLLCLKEIRFVTLI